MYVYVKFKEHLLPFHMGGGLIVGGTNVKAAAVFSVIRLVNSKFRPFIGLAHKMAPSAVSRSQVPKHCCCRVRKKIGHSILKSAHWCQDCKGRSGTNLFHAYKLTCLAGKDSCCIAQIRGICKILFSAF